MRECNPERPNSMLNMVAKFKWKLEGKLEIAAVIASGENRVLTTCMQSTFVSELDSAERHKARRLKILLNSIALKIGTRLRNAYSTTPNSHSLSHNSHLMTDSPAVLAMWLHLASHVYSPPCYIKDNLWRYFSESLLSSHDIYSYHWEI